MGITLALAIKDLRLMLRDKVAFFFTLFFPLAIAIFFGSVFSTGGMGASEMAILVVDEDASSQSKAFVDTLQASAELSIEIASREDAQNIVRRGDKVAYLVLKPGFGAARERPFWSGAPQVELGIDPSRKAEAGLLEGVITRYASEGMFSFMTDQKRMRGSIQDGLKTVSLASGWSAERKETFTRFLTELDRFLVEDAKEIDSSTTSSAIGESFAFAPVTFEKRAIAVERGGPKTSYDVTFPQGVVWAIIGCVASFAISLVIERSRGTLVRLRMAPIGIFHILAGKTLACFCTAVLISSVLLLFSVFVFGVRPNSPGLLALAIGCAAFSFCGIMMLLSVFGRTEQAAGGMAWAVLLIMSMAGGGMIPLFAMPEWLQKISHFSPVKWAVLALEGAVWRGFSLREMLLPCGILLAVGVVCFAVGLRAFRWTQQA